MTPHEPAVRSFRRRLAVLLVLKHLLPLAAAWGFAWGTAALAARAGLGAERLQLLWGALGLAPVLAAALWLGLRRLPPASAARAFLDHRSGAGGLLMAAAETEIGLWRTRLPPPPATSLRLRDRRAVLLLAAAALYVAAAFLVPARAGSPLAGRRLDLGEDVARLASQIETLREEKIVPPEEAADLKKKLDEIARDASAADPARAWEALDHLREKLANAAGRAAEKGVRETEKLAEAEALAAALEEARAAAAKQGEAQAKSAEAAPAPDPAAFRESMAALGELVADRELERLAARLDAEALKELKTLAELTKSDLEALKQAAELSRRLAELGEEALARLDAAGEVTLFRREPGASLAAWNTETRAGRPLDAERAARLLQGEPPRPFKAEPGDALRLDTTRFGGGDKLFVLDGGTSIVVYSPAPEPRATLERLEEAAGRPRERLGAEEAAATVAPAGAARLYVYDEEATRKCRSALQNAALRSVAGACGACKADILKTLRALADARLIDPRLLEQCRKAGDCSGAALAAGNLPGRGGVTRGRGDAAMTWKDPSSKEGAAFREEVIEPGAVSSLEKSELLGVSLGAPGTEAGAAASTGAALGEAAAGGGSAEKQAVLPRHRRTVARYFERE